MSSLTKRLTSAKKNKINELQDRVEELKLKLKEKETENKLLKKVQARQEKELSKYENSKSVIPNLFEYHNEEVRGLQNRLKQTKEKLLEVESKLKLRDTQLQNTKKELQRLQKLVGDNELVEKESLKQMVKGLKSDLEDKEALNQSLNKKLEILTKSHRQELVGEVARHKETLKKLTSLQQNYDKIQHNYQELRKSQDKQNIYTMSIARASSRIMINSGTFPKENSVASAKSSKTTIDYSLTSSDDSHPESPISMISINSPIKKNTLPEHTLKTPPESIANTKKETLLAKLNEMENKPETNGIDTQPEAAFVGRTNPRTKSPTDNMPDVSVNSAISLNPNRTSARRKSSQSSYSNENILNNVNKAENYTFNSDKKKSDLMISLFGKPSTPKQSSRDNDSIFDINPDIIRNKRNSRGYGGESIF